MIVRRQLGSVRPENPDAPILNLSEAMELLKYFGIGIAALFFLAHVRGGR